MNTNDSDEWMNSEWDEYNLFWWMNEYRMRLIQMIRMNEYRMRWIQILLMNKYRMGWIQMILCIQNFEDTNLLWKVQG